MLQEQAQRNFNWGSDQLERVNPANFTLLQGIAPNQRDGGYGARANTSPPPPPQTILGATPLPFTLGLFSFHLFFFPFVEQPKRIISPV